MTKEEKSMEEIIESEAFDTPKIVRNKSEFLIPENFVIAINKELEKRNGMVSLKTEVVNNILGWKPDKNRATYLKAKLNNQYPLDEGFLWHVRSQANGTLYTFIHAEIVED